MPVLSPNQRRVLVEIGSGVIDYGYPHFFKTAKALLKRGLIEHRPKSCPSYVITRAGAKLCYDALWAYKPKEGKE